MSNVVNFEALDEATHIALTAARATLSGIIAPGECGDIAKATYSVAKTEEVKLKGRLFQAQNPPLAVAGTK